MPEKDKKDYLELMEIWEKSNIPNYALMIEIIRRQKPSQQN
jgi:hypothetical protein